MFPFKGVRGQKAGVGVRYDSSGGAGDSVQNLDSPSAPPSAPYSPSQSILNKAHSFQQETQQIALNRIF